MKCDRCPARSKNSNWTGCLTLKHSIQDYDGCNRTEEKIRAELTEWFNATTESELRNFKFWKSDELNSCWISAEELKKKLEEN